MNLYKLLRSHKTKIKIINCLWNKSNCIVATLHMHTYKAFQINLKERVTSFLNISAHFYLSKSTLEINKYSLFHPSILNNTSFNENKNILVFHIKKIELAEIFLCAKFPYKFFYSNRMHMTHLNLKFEAVNIDNCYVGSRFLFSNSKVNIKS